MSFIKTKVTKALIKHFIGSNDSQPSTEHTEQPTNSDKPRKNKKNKWKIPPGLTEKEAKILKKVKKRAEILDVGFCVCCCCKLGLVPVAGDFFDFLYQANMRNAVILENYLVDRAKNRSVVMEDGTLEVIRPENAVPGRDRSGRF
ncbi:1875_t:CDS:2 [Racocetra fulgida]|uniref:1875_t:CDS:1 n=1 Tax=Racocetra fulgida TaxID=60492 RepID=A0A9N9EXW0_9GLOM|nr:1875_t:CDS:2 [Racocetra fulgida]